MQTNNNLKGLNKRPFSTQIDKSNKTNVEKNAKIKTDFQYFIAAETQNSVVETFYQKALKNKQIPCKVLQERCPNSPINCFSYSPDNHFLLTMGGTEKQGLKLFNHKNELIKVISLDQPVTLIVWSPNGKSFVTASTDYKLRLYDTDGNPIGEPITGHTESIDCIAWSPEGDRIVSGGHDELIRLHDKNGKLIGEPLKEFSQNPEKGFINHICGIMWLSDNTFIAKSLDETLRLYDKEGKLLSEPSLKKSVQSSYLTQTLALRETTETSIDASLKCYTNFSEEITLLPNGKGLVSFLDEKVQIWDQEAKLMAESVEVEHLSSLNRLACSPTEFRLITIACSSDIFLWSLDQEGKIQVSKLTYRPMDTVNCLKWAPAGDCFVVGSEDGSLAFFDKEGKTLIEPFSPSDGAIVCMEWSPDSSYLMTTDRIQLSLLRWG